MRLQNGSTLNFLLPKEPTAFNLLGMSRGSTGKAALAEYMYIWRLYRGYIYNIGDYLIIYAYATL